MRNRLEREIKRLCRGYQECCTEVEGKEEKGRIRRSLEKICRNVKAKLDISEPEVLLAMTDVYEVAWDEGMV